MNEPPDNSADRAPCRADLATCLADLLAPYEQIKAVEELAEAGAPVPVAEARRFLAKVKDWRPEEITGRDGKQQIVLRPPGEWRGEVFYFSGAPESGDIPAGLIRPLTLSKRAYLACVKSNAAASEREGDAAVAGLKADTVAAERRAPELGGKRPGAKETLYRLAERLCIEAGKVPYTLRSKLAAAYKLETGDGIHEKDALLGEVVKHFKTCDWKPPAQKNAEPRPST